LTIPSTSRKVFGIHLNPQDSSGENPEDPLALVTLYFDHVTSGYADELIADTAFFPGRLQQRSGGNRHSFRLLPGRLRTKGGGPASP
jgi:hypothetical protein